MTRFLTKGTISSTLGVLAFVLGMTGHSKIAQFLKDPDFIQNLSMLLGAGFSIYGGISQGVMPHAQPEPKSAPTPEDPYPGYDFDPIRGWVKIGD